MGAGAIAVWYRRRKRRQLMQAAVRARIPCGGAPVSAFEVFWDLGASDYALEIMGQSELLLTSGERLPWLYERLPQRIAEFGSYDSFLDTNLEAIEHFYLEHKQRQRPLELVSSERRLMLVSANPGPLVGEDSDAVDLDDLDGNPMGIVAGLLKGDVGGLVSWMTQSNARKLRDDLDRALAELYRLYATSSRGQPGRASPLEASAAAWDAEAMRLRRMRAERSWADEDWAPCADVLVDEAIELAADLASKSRENVGHVLGRIDQLGGGRNPARAGHLVYLNRDVLLPDRSGAVAAALADIEQASRALRHELSIGR